MDSVEAKEERIGFSFPADYKAFLREHPDGVKYYPKVIQMKHSPLFATLQKAHMKKGGYGNQTMKLWDRWRFLCGKLVK